MAGGYPQNHLFLVEGDPGTGKTTLALQFLLEGVRRGEQGLYITLSETAAELVGVATSHGWSLEGIEVFELMPDEEALRPDAQYTVFHPSEVELTSTTQAIFEVVERSKEKDGVERGVLVRETASVTDLDGHGALGPFGGLGSLLDVQRDRIDQRLGEIVLELSQPALQ